MKHTKLLLILFALLAFGSTAWAQDQTLTLNDGTNLRDEVPIRGWMDREGLGSQFIIPASELTAMQGGTINQLTFYAETASYSFYDAKYKVYITEVDYTEFEPEVFHSIFDIESASYCDWNTMADYYNGGVNISEKMMVITLTAPYHYTGGNLLIGIRLTEKGSNGDNINWYGMNQSTVSSVYPLYLGSNELYFSAQYLPKVTFGYTPNSSAPTCMWPIVNSATVTNHTATISWTENGEATAWQVCLNDDESNILDASTNSYTFTGLDIKTTYTAKVRSVCGGENHSPWSNKVTFTTTEACAPPTNLTAVDLTPPHATVAWDSYGESFRLQVSAIGGGSSKDWPSDNTHYYGFEENTISPWTQIDADGDGKMWEINSNPTSYGPYIANSHGNTGDKMVISGGADGIGRTFWPDNYLVSPRIMLGGSISFWARQYYNQGIEAFKVMVSTKGNTSASDFTPIANSNYELDHTQWKYYTVDLGAYDGQMGYVAFYDYDHGIHDALLLIDDITIVEGSHYIDIDGAINSYTMDVEPNTEYVMRVRTSCGINDGVSEWSDFYSFTTTDVVPIYEINSEEDWNAFAYAVDHGYSYSGETVSLNTDLNGITTMVGAKTVDNSYKYFKGTFNGNGHTLNVDYDGSGDWVAPFSSIENATIKNLHVTGSITTTGMRPAGIVSFVSGNSTISNCWSEVAISSSRNGDIDAGGLVARVNNNKTVNITDCLFSGSITYSNSGGYQGGGMVGFTQDGAYATLRNCYFAPSSISFEKSSGLEMYRFVGGKRKHVTIDNCYYNDVAASHTELTTQGGTNASAMSNETLLSNLGNGWEIKNEEVVPRMVFYTFSGEGTEVSPYLITTASDWNGLVNNVSLGTTYSDNHFKLTADISVTTMVGTHLNENTFKSFNGTFDGDGHTLNVAYSGSGDCTAPFICIGGATIKNLHVTGTIATTGMRPAGIASFVVENSTIENCWSEVAISSSHNSDIDAGGFVARVNENKSLTLNGCAFTGSITYSDANGYEGGGMVGYTQSGATATLYDCLFAPSAISIIKYNTTGDDWTKHWMFVGGRKRGTYHNCYYNDVAATAVEAGMVPETKNKRAHSITTNDQYISLGIQGTTSGTTIGVIGYGTGIQYDGVLYAGSGETVYLLLDYTQPGYDASHYYANETKITLNDSDSYTLNMPNANVVITADVTTAEWEGTGADWEHAYQILNKDQLNMLATRVNDGNDYSNKYFKLMGNITYTYTNASNNTNYTPIGNSSSHKFNGHFDGQNYTISGVRDKSGSETDIRVKGLFGYLGSDAEVKNIVLSNAQFYLGRPISGIAGDNEGTVTNCHVTSDVEFRGTLNSSYIMGGIVGINQSTGTVSHCTFAGTLNRNHRDFSNNNYEYGGIVGENHGTVTDNLVCGATIYQVPIQTINSNTGYGAIVGFPHSGTIARNYYAACTIVTTEWEYIDQFNGHFVSNENATGVGSGGLTQTLDLTTNDGAVPGNTRTISGYGDSEETNWAFIASPLTATTSPVSSAVENIFSAPEYDLYRLNSVSSRWENWKAGEGNNAAPGFSLENGRGYLYATKEQETVKFIGTTTSAYNLNDTKEVTLGDGFNLVGNPFPRAAWVNKPYYTLNENGSAVLITSKSTATPISPCYGVVVEATGSETLTFSTTAPGSVGAAPNNGNLNIALSQTDLTRGASETLLDNAVVSFNEGEQLGKFRFGSNAEIYLPQAGKDYAIAFSAKHGEIPLNFKATENSSYTLTVNPEGVNMAYLHLIDNLTGNDVDLLAEPSYTFTGRTTDYTSRFKLVFLANDAQIGGEGSDDFAFISNGQLIVIGITDNSVLQIIDLTGRVLSSPKASNRINIDGLSAGVYVLRLINGENVKTQKIVVK